MLMKIYEVSFETHVNCTIYSYLYYCEAKNAEAAKAIARQNWKYKSYQFYLKAARCKEQDVSKLSVKSEYFVTYSGPEAMNRYVHVASRVWRIDGRNLYGT